MNGADLITAERQRQIEVEGYDSVHDAQEHADEMLCYAAIAYTFPLEHEDGARFLYWPWDLKSFKPTPDDRIRELVKAGALIAAEIDRLNAERAEP